MTHSSDDQTTRIFHLAADDITADRVDRFLAARFVTPSQHLSRSRIKALILDGQLSEDGRTLTDPSAPVKPGASYALILQRPVNAVGRRIVGRTVNKTGCRFVRGIGHGSRQ